VKNRPIWSPCLTSRSSIIILILRRLAFAAAPKKPSVCQQNFIHFFFDETTATSAAHITPNFLRKSFLFGPRPFRETGSRPISFKLITSCFFFAIVCRKTWLKRRTWLLNLCATDTSSHYNFLPFFAELLNTKSQKIILTDVTDQRTLKLAKMHQPKPIKVAVFNLQKWPNRLQSKIKNGLDDWTMKHFDFTTMKYLAVGLF